MKKKIKVNLPIIGIVLLIIILIPFKITIKNGYTEITALSYKYINYDNYNNKNKIMNGYHFKLLGLVNIENYKEDTDSKNNSSIKEFNPKPLIITWNPHIYNRYLKQNKSESYEKKYHEMVDAIIEGKQKVYCNDRDEAYDLMMTLNENFPPFVKVVHDYNYVNGYMEFNYNGTKNERTKIIEDFGKRIEEIIKSSVMETDTKTMAAISLYHFYASKITYDYEAMEDEKTIHDLSVYRGLMDYSGICQTFGPAYAYLLNVLDIDAIEAGALNVDPNVDAHSWTLMKLNGKEYFSDVTFELSTSGNGLRYFGMNRERREIDGYLQKDTSIGFNLMKANKLNIEDNKFEILAACDEVLEIKRSKEKMEIIFMTPKGEKESFIITE